MNSLSSKLCSRMKAVLWEVKFLLYNPITYSAFRDAFFQSVGAGETVVLDFGLHIIELTRRMLLEILGVLQDVGGDKEMAVGVFQQELVDGYRCLVGILRISTSEHLVQND